MPDEIVMNDLLDAFGVQPPSDPPEDPKDGTGDPPPEDPPKDPPEDPPTDPPADAPEDPPADVTKANKAFAAMRAQNTQYQKILKGLAGVLNVADNADPAAFTEALQQKIIEAQAKQQNIDPQLLTRLQVLEEQNQTMTRKEMERAAYLGFQQVKDKFGLDNKALGEFADTLAAQGIDPFSQQVNLTSMYVEKNYDQLVKAAEERGMKAEQTRAATANNHSTTPSDKDGKTADPPAKINSISDLNTFFDNQGAK